MQKKNARSDSIVWRLAALTNDRMVRRLLPLYISSFFQGFIFWYAIEKIFMTRIGFTDLTIALAVIVTSLVGMCVAVPSGVLADRWSRKKVLLLALAALGLSSLLLGFSYSVAQYIISGILFALFPTIHAGVLDAMIYDTLLEEQGTRRGYERYFGISSFLYGTATVVGSLLGGLIAAKVGLATSYYLSVLSVAIAIVALGTFREPELHLAATQDHARSAVRQVFRAVLRRRTATYALIAVMFTTAISDFMIEVDQLWPIALHLRMELFGPLNAFLLLGYSLGGILAAPLLRRRLYILSAGAVGVAGVLALSVRSMMVIAAAQFVILCIFIALYTIAVGKLHDTLPSSLRSGGSSLANMLSSALFTPLVFIFGRIAQSYSVFAAARLLFPVSMVGIAGVAMACGLFASTRRVKLSAVPEKASNPIPED